MSFADKIPPKRELAFIRNKIEERELVIRENLQKAGKNPEEGYSLLDIGCGEGFLLKLWCRTPERTVEVYRLLGEMGFGREIVGVFRKG